MSDNGSKQVRGTGQLIKELNRSRVLECFVGGDPLSRVEVAERTGLSLPAVTHLVAELETEQMLVRVGKGESSGGRPPILYEYNARLAYIIGLDLGGTNLAGGVSDLEGNLLVIDRVSTHDEPARLASGSQLHERVRNFVSRLLETAHVDLSKVMGIGIGVPGIPDEAGGEIGLAPGLREQRDATSVSVGLVRYLEAELGRPVYVDNDVNMILQGERWKGALQGKQHGVCITIGTGIGVGLLTNGEVYRGASGAAGEIGYWLVGALGPVIEPDGYGPLETFAAGPGIARRYQTRLKESGIFEASSVGSSPGSCSELTARDAAVAAAAGDPVAVDVWRETVDTLGVALANLATLLNPEVIVVGGGVSMAPEQLFLEPLRDIVNTLAPYPPRIVASELGERAGIYGAVATVVHSRRSSISYLSPEVMA